MRDKKVLKIKFNGADIHISVGDLNGGFVINAEVFDSNKEFPDAQSHILVNKCIVCGKYEVVEKHDNEHLCGTCFNKLKAKVADRTPDSLVAEPIRNAVERQKASKPKGVKKINPLMRFVKANPAKIKIVNFEKYKFRRLKEDAITKIFELIIGGYNTNKLIEAKTGLAPISVSTYLAVMSKGGLIYRPKGTNIVEPVTTVKYIYL